MKEMNSNGTCMRLLFSCAILFNLFYVLGHEQRTQACTLTCYEVGEWAIPLASVYLSFETVTARDGFAQSNGFPAGTQAYGAPVFLVKYNTRSTGSVTCQPVQSGYFESTNSFSMQDPYSMQPKAFCSDDDGETAVLGSWGYSLANPSEPFADPFDWSSGGLY